MASRCFGNFPAYLLQSANNMACLTGRFQNEVWTFARGSFGIPPRFWVHLTVYIDAPAAAQLANAIWTEGLVSARLDGTASAGMARA
jgi:hypothetical protein